jgi:hypothetical protein
VTTVKTTQFSPQFYRIGSDSCLYDFRLLFVLAFGDRDRRRGGD